MGRRRSSRSRSRSRSPRDRGRRSDRDTGRYKHRDRERGRDRDKRRGSEKDQYREEKRELRKKSDRSISIERGYNYEIDTKEEIKKEEKGEFPKETKLVTFALNAKNLLSKRKRPAGPTLSDLEEQKSKSVDLKENSTDDSILSEAERRKKRLLAWKSKKQKLEIKASEEKSPDVKSISKENPEAHKKELGPEEKNNFEEGGEDVDPLDAFMESLISENPGADTSKPFEDKRDISSTMAKEDEDEDEVFVPDEQGDELSWLTAKQKKLKKKEIKLVDHLKANYIPFRKDFYIESAEIASMSSEEIEEYRKTVLEGVKIRGLNCPKPIMKWTQCGLPSKVQQVMQKLNYSSPFPIQAQAIPCIMSGRDCIACAKTGSGKTLAFVLPMLRQILDQPPLAASDGPIGLILAPTRELAIQIATEVRKFSKVLGLRVVCCYGGSGVAAQIADLKRGAEVVVATPGRMIDMLCANHGKVTNLKRVTFLVLDEADRMFDMGFEPQISAIIQNIRPDRQTVMFSATFPKQIEGLAKKALKNPVEIIIGGRSVASNTIEQFVEVREENTKFKRLIQILKEWYDRGSILIFVDKQESVDALFSELMKSGYPCLALHGGMDQSDRDYTILDFKKGLRTILVATSVAARGLDVKELVLVVNYVVPHHYEDYIHRIGRTGRAATKGTAITFITPDQERLAPDIVKALESSKQPIPPELRALADAFESKFKAGLVRFSSNSGYATKGFKFDENEAQKKVDQQNLQKRAYGVDVDEMESQEVEVIDLPHRETSDSKGNFEDQFSGSASAPSSITDQIALARQAAKAAKEALTKSSGGKISSAAEFSQQARKLEEAMKLKAELGKSGLLSVNVQTDDISQEAQGSFSEEIEINDYPQAARWKVTQKNTIEEIEEWMDVAITRKGTFVPEGRKALPGERKLYLLIDGQNQVNVLNAKAEIRRVLEETAMSSSSEQGPSQYGKYSVV